MVKNSEEPMELRAENGSGEEDKSSRKPNKQSPFLGNSKDCHNVVKSSGLSKGKRRLCCEHRAGVERGAVSVGVQTVDCGGWGQLPSSSSPPPLPASPRKDADGSRSEGTLRLMIQNFRNMSDTVRGPGKVVSGVPWKIMVMPRQHVVAKKGTQKCLGFFLQCCPDSYSDSWSCQASAELRLIAQKPGVTNFIRKTTHLYTAKENDWGYSCFMTWADILEEAQGYMKEEKVVLEVHVKAESPKGILSRAAFVKKIEDYMRLAEMQRSRGLVDKAIEVNSTALKFAKDKDAESKAGLERQRNRLIEMKLKESIERIEKGRTNGDAAEEGSNLHSLKAALSSGAARKKEAKGPRKTPLPSPPEQRKTYKEEVEESEASCSEDSEGEEEFCDGCLQEQLDTISGERITAESAAQTDAAQPTDVPPQLDLDRPWSDQKEQELLDLITHESRASLDSIKDTLERLVSLAREGEVPAGLDVDLEALRKETEERDLLNVPLVQIPTPDAPPPLPPPNAKREASPPAAFPLLGQKYSAEEYSLIQHAKEIVEEKAGQLVSKYSQLIEQSEATKLAETVKKVEKRMKDIEKQTMTCRKELSDECERHAREEAKLLKANKQLKTQLDSQQEKSDKVNTQLKEKKAEIRRLEKRLKAESAMSVEKAELLSRLETVEADLARADKRLAEETRRSGRDSAAWADARRQLQAELAAATAETDRLNNLLEEKTVALRKTEAKGETDRRQTHASLRDALERAKKAEVNLLEFKLEMGVKMLQQAAEDCQNNMKHLEELYKRHAANQQSPQALKPLTAYIQEWLSTRDRIQDLLSKAKAEFGGQIEAVKSGKALASLPTIEVPKPPPPPRPQTFPPQQHMEIPRQPIAPIGARPGGTPEWGGNADMRSPAHALPPDSSHLNGFSPWSDPLSDLTESLLGARNMGLSPLDSWGSPSHPAAQPPIGGGGQWGVGWGYHQVTTAPSQSAADAFQPPQAGDSRGNSPVTGHNERYKRVETLMDHLQATFPNVSAEVLREYVNEFRAQQPSKSLKGLSVESALNGVLALLLHRNGKMLQNWKGGGGVSLGLDSFAPPPTHPPRPEVGLCLTCGEDLQGQSHLALKCRHRFHTKCVKDWLHNQQTCPTCGKYAPSPEEYPELA